MPAEEVLQSVDAGVLRNEFQGSLSGVERIAWGCWEVIVFQIDATCSW